MSISLSTPFLRFLPAEPPLWSISVSCGQQGVCVHLQPCPVKYRLFKEVSNIIWPLYCNYKLLLLEAAHRERAAHRHLQSLPPKANAISRSPPADAPVSVSSRPKDSFTCVDLDVVKQFSSLSSLLVTFWQYPTLMTQYCPTGCVRNPSGGWPSLTDPPFRETLWSLGSCKP